MSRASNHYQQWNPLIRRPAGFRFRSELVDLRSHSMHAILETGSDHMKSKNALSVPSASLQPTVTRVWLLSAVTGVIDSGKCEYLSSVVLEDTRPRLSVCPRECWNQPNSNQRRRHAGLSICTGNLEIVTSLWVANHGVHIRLSWQLNVFRSWLAEHVFRIRTSNKRTNILCLLFIFNQI